MKKITNANIGFVKSNILLLQKEGHAIIRGGAVFRGNNKIDKMVQKGLNQITLQYVYMDWFGWISYTMMYTTDLDSSLPQPR